VLGHDLINPYNFRVRQGFVLCLFKEKKLEGSFTLNPITKVVGYSTLKTELKN
jgi:hypothetical protein